jgi:hypothetical protein
MNRVRVLVVASFAWLAACSGADGGGLPDGQAPGDEGAIEVADPGGTDPGPGDPAALDPGGDEGPGLDPGPVDDPGPGLDPAVGDPGIPDPGPFGDHGPGGEHGPGDVFPSDGPPPIPDWDSDSMPPLPDVPRPGDLPPLQDVPVPPDATMPDGMPPGDLPPPPDVMPPPDAVPPDVSFPFDAPPPPDALPPLDAPSDAGPIGPVPCLDDGFCTAAWACPPDAAKGCRCVAGPGGQKVCTPACEFAADCPHPPGPVLVCTAEGLCVPQS